MFDKKLVELRKEKKLSQYELAEKLGFSRGKLANYEQGTRQPDFETLKKIADFFEVSTDYLLGRSDLPNLQQAGIAKEDYANLSEYQKEVLDFFMNLDDLAFKDKPEDILAALEQFELYYKMYKEQQAKKQK